MNNNTISFYRREVFFTEDEWTSIYKGVVYDYTNGSYYVESLEYGNFWIPKSNCVCPSIPESITNTLSVEIIQRHNIYALAHASNKRNKIEHLSFNNNLIVLANEHI